jgi:hypothetical protein
VSCCSRRHEAHLRQGTQDRNKAASVKIRTNHGSLLIHESAQIVEYLGNLVHTRLYLSNFSLSFLNKRFLVRQLMRRQLRLQDLCLSLLLYCGLWLVGIPSKSALMSEARRISCKSITNGGWCCSSSTASLTPATTVLCFSTLTCCALWNATRDIWRSCEVFCSAVFWCGYNEGNKMRFTPA